MPTSSEGRTRWIDFARFLRANPNAEVLASEVFEEALKIAIRHEGFTSTLKSLKKGRLPKSGMITVFEGVVEEHPTGLCDAALDTDKGPLLLRGARRPNYNWADPQWAQYGSNPDDGNTTDSAAATPSQLLTRFAHAGVDTPSNLICEMELTRFEAEQRRSLLPLLWQFITCHRNSNVPERLVAVGAAIRKYVAIMPMEDMGRLADLLESGSRSPLPIELEIEVAKMVYRNFETHPPSSPDPQPKLAQRLWEIVQAYMNPRILPRDKHSAAASLSIQAIIAMRSQLAQEAWNAASRCPYRWFTEVISDRLDQLRERWSEKNSEAAAWLSLVRETGALHI